MAAGAQLQQQALVLHERLMQGDRTAPLDASQLILDPLVVRLRNKWPQERYADACYDTAVEVFVAYLNAPERYDPSKSALLTWLTMQAHGDLINAYRSRQQRFEGDWIVESALTPSDPGGGPPVALGDQLPSLDTPPSLEESTVFARVREAFPDERDRQLIWSVYVDGVHSTETAAEILGLTDLPPAEQARAVKKNKDRIMRRLRRIQWGDPDE